MSPRARCLVCPPLASKEFKCGSHVNNGHGRSHLRCWRRRQQFHELSRTAIPMSLHDHRKASPSIQHHESTPLLGIDNTALLPRLRRTITNHVLAVCPPRSPVSIASRCVGCIERSAAKRNAPSRRAPWPRRNLRLARRGRRLPPAATSRLAAPWCMSLRSIHPTRREASLT